MGNLSMEIDRLLEETAKNAAQELLKTGPLSFANLVRSQDAFISAMAVEKEILDPVVEIPNGRANAITPQERRRRARLPGVVLLTRQLRRNDNDESRGLIPGGESLLAYSMALRNRENDPDPIWQDAEIDGYERGGLELLIERAVWEGILKADFVQSIFDGKITVPPVGHPEREKMYMDLKSRFARAKMAKVIE